jgi:uncharacterized membrane protein
MVVGFSSPTPNIERLEHHALVSHFFLCNNHRLETPQSAKENKMIFYIVAGVFSALAILFLLAKFDFKKVLWLDIPIDIASTILLVVMFAGTFAGMMAAVIGGCIISITLFSIKRIAGYKKPKWKKFGYEWVETSK